MSSKQRIIFVHPDLGVGGAERLVVDAAVGLQHRGYDVTVCTSRHYSDRCFSETADGTLKVREHGNFLPRSLFGKMHIVFAWLRSLWLAWTVILFYQCDVIFVDQISLAVPLFRYFKRVPVLFYCHFPDKLLSSHDSPLKRLYRAPIDWLEETTTGCANKIVCNSEFTKATIAKAFPTIDVARVDVLYPGVHLTRYDTPPNMKNVREEAKTVVERAKRNCGALLLSINRFERKKRLDVAIDALAWLLKQPGTVDRGSAALRDANINDEDDSNSSKSSSTVTNSDIVTPNNGGGRRMCSEAELLLCGGYDTGVAENVEHYLELEALARKSGVQHRVTMIRSFNDDERAYLLRECTLLIYTPPNEHFGIVPVEAMYTGTPLVACRSGGPCESVVDGVTGRLCAECDGETFARAARLIINAGADTRRKMGANGRKRVQQLFSLDAFAKRLDEFVSTIVSDQNK